jgi:hypothetical protein
VTPWRSRTAWLRAIADQIRINVTPQEQAALKSVKVVNPEAYESYLKGRYFWNKRTADSLKVALAYFIRRPFFDHRCPPELSSAFNKFWRNKPQG